MTPVKKKHIKITQLYYFHARETADKLGYKNLNCDNPLKLHLIHYLCKHENEYSKKLSL